MNRKSIISFCLVTIMIISSTVFAAITKISFSFEKFKMGLGTTQSIAGIMTVYGHDLDYSDFEISDKTVVRFTSDRKSIEAVGTGISNLTYTYLTDNEEEKTISCRVEVTATSAVVGSNTTTYHYITLVSADSETKLKCQRGLEPTLPELTRDGYTFSGWYLDAEYKTEYKKTWLQKDLTLYAKWEKIGEEENKVPTSQALYSDIADHWARGKIEYVTREGIFNGTGSDKFSPDANMTRAMVVTVLGRVAGIKLEGRTTNFTDVPSGAYYEEYVAWAVENGIAQGVSETEFNPNRNITREELAVMFANYIKYTGKDYGEIEDIEYNDNDDISSWAIDAVKMLKSYNVMKGNAENNFSPKALATRAEVAVVFYNFYMIKG